MTVSGSALIQLAGSGFRKFLLQNFIFSLAECNLLLVEDKFGFHGGELAAQDMFSITNFADFAFITAAHQICSLLLKLHALTTDHKCAEMARFLFNKLFFVF